jgi:hypothetical protein
LLKRWFDRQRIYTQLLFVVVTILLFALVGYYCVLGPQYRQWHSALQQQQQLDRAIRSLQQVDPDRFDVYSSEVVSPVNVARSLHTMLRTMPHLTMKEFKVLPAIKHGSFFEHGFQLILRGHYNDIMHYLDMLQAKNPSLYWRKIDYKVIHYPQARVVLQLAIINQQPNWFETSNSTASKVQNGHK